MDTETARSLPAQEFYESHYRQDPHAGLAILLGADAQQKPGPELVARARAQVPEGTELQVLGDGEVSAEAIYQLIQDGRGSEVFSDLMAIEKAS